MGLFGLNILCIFIYMYILQCISYYEMAGKKNTHYDLETIQPSESKHYTNLFN